ncbi:MAG: hypothetical protein ACR2QM_20845 [Longimicrobiales bacterium]
MIKRSTPRPRGVGQLVALAMMVSAGACDFPTEAPQWDTEWLVPVDSAQISVTELLPASVGLTPDSSAFEVSLDPLSFSQTLAEMCSSCPPGSFPKPAFQSSFSDPTTLPTDVEGVTVRSAIVSVVLDNGLSFDPVRPGGAETGELRVTLRDGDETGPILAERVIDGASDSIPSGDQYPFDFDLGNQSFGSTLTAVVTVDSPSGPTVLMTPSDEFGIDVTPSTVVVDEAIVRLQDQAVNIDPVTVDADEVPDGVLERLESGAIRVQVENPFDVVIGMQLEISGPGVPTIQKDLTVGMGSVEERVDLTAAEMRSFLGQSDVVLSGSGDATAPTGTTAVRADQFVLLNSFLEATVRVGS